MNNKKLKLTKIFDPLLKNQKFPIIMNFTFFFNKNVWKLTLYKLNVLVHDHKIQTKQKFIEYFNEQKNIRIILTLLAIGIGGYQITQIRYKDHFYFYFLRKNFSSVCLPFPTLTWETFNYLNYKYYLEQQIKRIDVYNDFLYIEMKPFWQNKQKQLYIGEFLPNSLFINEASNDQLNFKNNSGWEDFASSNWFNNDVKKLKDVKSNLTQLRLNDDVNTQKNNSLYNSTNLNLQKPIAVVSSAKRCNHNEARYSPSSETKFLQLCFLPSHNISQFILSEKIVYQGDELPNKLENSFETIERSSIPQIELNKVTQNEFSLLFPNDPIDQKTLPTSSNLTKEELKEFQVNQSQWLNLVESNPKTATNETLGALGEISSAQLHTNNRDNVGDLAELDLGDCASLRSHNLPNTQNLPNVPTEPIAFGDQAKLNQSKYNEKKSSPKFPFKFIFAPTAPSFISPSESTLFFKNRKKFTIEPNFINSVPLFAYKNTISKASIGRSPDWASSFSDFQNNKSSISNIVLKNSNVGDLAALDRFDRAKRDHPDFRKNAYYENLENFQQKLKKIFTEYVYSDFEAILSDLEKQQNEDPFLLDEEIELEPLNLSINELNDTQLLNDSSSSYSIESIQTIQLNESKSPSRPASNEHLDFTQRHPMEFISEFKQFLDDLSMQPRKMSGYQYPDSSIVNPKKLRIFEKILFNNERKNSHNSENWSEVSSNQLGELSFASLAQFNQLGELSFASLAQFNPLRNSRSSLRGSSFARSGKWIFDQSSSFVGIEHSSIDWLKIIKKIKNTKKLDIFSQTTFPQLSFAQMPSGGSRFARSLPYQSKILKITSIPKNFYSTIQTTNQWKKTNLEKLSYTNCSQPNNISISNKLDQNRMFSKTKLKPNLQNTDFEMSFLLPKNNGISETQFPKDLTRANGLSESTDAKQPREAAGAMLRELCSGANLSIAQAASRQPELCSGQLLWQQPKVVDTEAQFPKELNFVNSKLQTQYLRTNLNNYKAGFGGINVLSIEKVYEKFPKLIEQLKTESVYGPNLFENLEKLPFMSQKNYFRVRSLFQNHKMTWVDRTQFDPLDWSEFNKKQLILSSEARSPQDQLNQAQLNYDNATLINEPRELSSFVNQSSDSIESLDSEEQLIVPMYGIQSKGSLVSKAPSDLDPSCLGESSHSRWGGDFASLNRFNSNKPTQPKKTHIVFHFFTNSQTTLTSSEMQNIGYQIIYQKRKPNHDQILSLNLGDLASLDRLKNNSSTGRSSFNTDLNTSLQYGLSSFREFVIRINKHSHFSEIWEPLSNNWYMVLTQISFVFFVVKLMEDLYKKDYGSEIVSYIIEYIPPQFIEFLELDMVINSHKELRNIQKIEKRFKNIAGVSNLLPELGDLVWFLKNYDKNSVLLFNILNQILKPNKRGGSNFVRSFTQLPQTVFYQLSKNFSLSKAVNRNANYLGDQASLDQTDKKTTGGIELRREAARSPIESIYLNQESNKTRSYWNNRRGILLVGPPGTGKTLLVQAIAGEAGVPVLVQSASLLISQQNQTQETGDFRLKRLFDAARDQAPCIIFIDEIDSIGLKRENIMQHSSGNDNLIESIYTRKSSSNNRNLKQKRTSSAFNNDFDNFLPTPIIDTSQNNSNKTSSDREELFKQSASIHSVDEASSSLENQIAQNQITTSEYRQQQLTILTQFLVEMDGLKSLKGVVVVGATNRPETLDNALIRPGRLDRVLNIKLPGKTKRIDILKLYSQNLGVELSISWDYLASRTVGLSAAHLSAIMNRSAIQAILENTKHSTETIEYGIDAVSSSNSQKSKFQLMKLLSLGDQAKLDRSIKKRNDFTNPERTNCAKRNSPKFSELSEKKLDNAQAPFDSFTNEHGSDPNTNAWTRSSSLSDRVGSVFSSKRIENRSSEARSPEQIARSAIAPINFIEQRPIDRKSIYPMTPKRPIRGQLKSSSSIHSIFRISRAHSVLNIKNPRRLSFLWLNTSGNFGEIERSEIPPISRNEIASKSLKKNNLIEVFQNKYAYIQVLNLNFDRILINTQLNQLSEAQSPGAKQPDLQSGSIFIDIKNNEKQFYQKNRGRIKKILFFGKLLKTKINQFQKQLANCCGNNQRLLTQEQIERNEIPPNFPNLCEKSSNLVDQTAFDRLSEVKFPPNRAKLDSPNQLSETSFQPIKRSFIPPAQSTQMDFSLYITSNSIEEEILTVFQNLKTNCAQLNSPNLGDFASLDRCNETILSRLSANERVYNDSSPGGSRFARSNDLIKSIEPNYDAKQPELCSGAKQPELCSGQASLDSPERSSNTTSLVTNEIYLDIAYRIKLLQIKRSSFVNKEPYSFNLDKVSLDAKQPELCSGQRSSCFAPKVERLSDYSSEFPIDENSLKFGRSNIVRSNYQKSKKMTIIHNFVEFLNEFHFTIFDLIQNIQLNFGLFPNWVKGRLIPNTIERNEILYTYSSEILLISSSLNGSYFGSSTFQFSETFEYSLSLKPMNKLNQMLQKNFRQVELHELHSSENQTIQSVEKRFDQSLQFESIDPIELRSIPPRSIPPSHFNKTQFPQYEGSRFARSNASVLLNRLPIFEKSIEYPLSSAYLKNETLKKLSYYQAGRAFFDQFSREALINLWPKLKNLRKFSSGNLLTHDYAMNFLHFSRCYEFENYIISLLSGKGAEFFILSTQSEKIREAHASSSYLIDFEKTNDCFRLREAQSPSPNSPNESFSSNYPNVASLNCNNFSSLNVRRQDPFLIQTSEARFPQSSKLTENPGGLIFATPRSSSISDRVDQSTSHFNFNDRESAHYPSVQSTINKVNLLLNEVPYNKVHITTKRQEFNNQTTFNSTNQSNLSNRANKLISSSFDCAKRNPPNSLKNIRYYLFESFLTCQDTIQATQLLESMIDKWSFYSKKLLTRTSIKLPKNRQYQEIHQENEIEFLLELSNEIEKEFSKEIGFQKFRQNPNYQKWLTRAWWQNQITYHFRDFENRLDWYRVYLPDPDERHWNEEYVPSDSYYQNQQTHYSVTNSNIQSSYLQISFENPNFLTISFHFYEFIETSKSNDFMFIQHEKRNTNEFFEQKPINSSSVEDVDKTFSNYTLLNWNDFSKLDRDLIFQKIILNSVNTSFLRFDTSRDLLDYFADYLLRYEKLRSHEIQKINVSFSVQKH
uniref:Cell division protein n=2 Tax=Ignatiaceae TaxID=2682551 RepID=A0A1W6EGP6_9CHLO|nr:cell division protein [Pseudocharacium americanum]YP_009367693.1 cell division protein [Ignatius tetrasporus]ARK14563.1 cell division protein [Pseudocharacium americanum]ARK14652.1 cell division protein [Ignatius tetrasporus]